MSNWTYKQFFFIGLILIALGVNFNTTLKEYSVGPLGTVFIAIASINSVYSEKFMLGNHRSKVINKAVNKAFEMLLKEIFKN